MAKHAQDVGTGRRDHTRQLNLAFALLATVGLVVSSCEGTRSTDRMRGGDPGDPLARLVGTSPERMREILGNPAFARTDGPAEMWRSYLSGHTKWEDGRWEWTSRAGTRR